jgi:hypothetical protein
MIDCKAHLHLPTNHRPRGCSSEVNCNCTLKFCVSHLKCRGSSLHLAKNCLLLDWFRHCSIDCFRRCITDGSKRDGEAGGGSTAPSQQQVKKARQSLEHNERDTNRTNDAIITATLGIEGDKFLDAQPIAVQRLLATADYVTADSGDEQETAPAYRSTMPALMCRTHPRAPILL